MLGPRGVVRRVVARVRALFSQDWFGNAGSRFRETTTAISEFAEDSGIRPEDLIVDGVRKLKGLANKEFAAALQAYTDVEQKKIEIELKRRTLETTVIKDRAEARLAEIKALDAELELLRKLKEMKLAVLRNENGDLTIVPAPESFDPTELYHRRLEVIDADEGAGTDPPDVGA